MSVAMANTVIGRGDRLVQNVFVSGMYRIFVCPRCMTPSGKMTLTDRVHTMCIDELETRPYLQSIGRDVFRCTCGSCMTWFDMLELRLIEFQWREEASFYETCC